MLMALLPGGPMPRSHLDGSVTEPRWPGIELGQIPSDPPRLGGGGGKRLPRLLDPSGVLMDDHLGVGELLDERRLYLVGDPMRLGEPHVAVHLQMHLDEG